MEWRGQHILSTNSNYKGEKMIKKNYFTLEINQRHTTNWESFIHENIEHWVETEQVYGFLSKNAHIVFPSSPSTLLLNQVVQPGWGTDRGCLPDMWTGRINDSIFQYLQSCLSSKLITPVRDLIGNSGRLESWRELHNKLLACTKLTKVMCMHSRVWSGPKLLTRPWMMEPVSMFRGNLRPEECKWQEDLKKAGNLNVFANLYTHSSAESGSLTGSVCLNTISN